MNHAMIDSKSITDIELIDNKNCHAKVAEAGGEPARSHGPKQGKLSGMEMVHQRRSCTESVKKKKKDFTSFCQPTQPIACANHGNHVQIIIKSRHKISSVSQHVMLLPFGAWRLWRVDRVGMAAFAAAYSFF